MHNPPVVSNVLVVSNDPDAQNNLALPLSDPALAFTVTSAGAVLSHWQREQPALLLVDLDEPALSDPSGLAALCAATQPTPIILLGASAAALDPARLAAYGGRIVDWLPKPVTAAELRLRLLWRLQSHTESHTGTQQGQFLATLSHEIRTPLSSLIGIAEVLEASPLNPQQHNLLTTLHQSALHLLRLINELLDYSKIEAGRLELEAIPFSPQTLFAAVHATLLPLAEKKSLHLDLHLPDNLPQRLRGDPLRLQQVLLNLGHNGIKFTDYGSVTFTVTASTDTETQNCRLGIIVADTGIGIPATALARLFVPFQQVSTATSRHFGGTGLGLAISQQLIGQMGGHIQAHSQPGLGSTFSCSLLLPLADASERDLAAVNTIELQPDLLAQRRILIVEDFAPNREILALQLQDLGCTIDCAENGLDAVERAGQHRYDAILMDIHMPHLDGIEATRRIRAAETRSGQPPVPIIAVTADAQTQERQHCFDAGMNDYLVKPYRKQGLATVLLRWLPASVSLPTARPPFQQLIDDLSPSGAAALFQTVLTHTPPQLERLLDALQRRDWTLAGQVAHRLKGTARFYSDPEVHELLEQVGKLQDPATDASVLAHTIEQAYQHIFSRLRQEISRLTCLDDIL